MEDRDIRDFPLRAVEDGDRVMAIDAAGNGKLIGANDFGGGSSGGSTGGFPIGGIIMWSGRATTITRHN